jgi:hypothetical protein
MINYLKLAISLFLILSLASCTTRTQLHQLSDLSDNQQLLLRKRLVRQPTYGLLVLGKGYINGEARISLLLDGKVYQTKVVSGNVKFQWRENWRDSRAILRYQPRSVTDGNLRFSVTFMD